MLPGKSHEDLFVEGKMKKGKERGSCGPQNGTFGTLVKLRTTFASSKLKLFDHIFNPFCSDTKLLMTNKSIAKVHHRRSAVWALQYISLSHGVFLSQ